ncbi:MAG: hypothetical protein SOT81_00645, partial [Treponema sp.]|nr:hypothetical protein [Treponema sp.]
MKRPITIISIISILLFIAALSWFGIGIYQDGKSGSEHNERVFDTLVFKTVNAANQYKIGTPDFSKKFIEAIGKIENYSALRLEANGNLIYSYPPAGFSLPSPSLTNTFKKNQIANGGISLTISASMYSIQTNSVYHYAQFAFVLILLGTSISLLLLVILRDKKEKTDSKTTNNADKNLNDEINIDYGDENNIFDDNANDAEFLDETDEKTENEENPFDKIDFGEDEDDAEKQISQEKSEDLESKDSESSDSASNSLSKNKEENQFFESYNGETEKTDREHIEENAPKTASTQENPKTGETKPEDFDENAEESELPFATDISDGDFDIQDDNFSAGLKNEKNDEDFSENLNDASYSKSERNNENDEKTLEEASAINESNADDDGNFGEEEKSEKFETESANENENNDFLSNFDFDENADISPATGLKMQSALSKNLGEKIKQSLNEKKELTLALLKINNLDRGNAISNKLVEILKNDISETAEIFEYNSDGYAIILYDEDLSL